MIRRSGIYIKIDVYIFLYSRGFLKLLFTLQRLVVIATSDSTMAEHEIANLGTILVVFDTEGFPKVFLRWAVLPFHEILQLRALLGDKARHDPPLGIRASEPGPTGVIIWLEHGTIICWDGRMVRHCTSLALAGSGEGNTTLGFFVSEAK